MRNSESVSSTISFPGRAALLALQMGPPLIILGVYLAAGFEIAVLVGLGMIASYQLPAWD